MKKTTVLILIVSLFILSEVFAIEENIKSGNVVNITVLGYPELSKQVLVRQDGTIDYPLLSNIPIDGLTTSELGELLSPILMRYVTRPHLFINISEYYILNIRILGQVDRPGTYKVEGPIDLQGALSQAGGPTENADLRNIKIVRSIKNVKTELTVDLFEAFRRDEHKAVIPEMMDGDMIIVPITTSESYVRVYGAVSRPGMYVPGIGTNLMDIINKAGGASAGADMNSINLIRRDNDSYQSTRIKLRNMIKKGEQDKIPLVNPGDIVIINQKSAWKNTSLWIMIFRDAVVLTSSIVILARIY